MKILITGATGNVGQAILAHLVPDPSQQIFVATREKDSKVLGELFFDFDDLPRTLKSLEGIHTLFLLRPPQISDVGTYFKPLLEGAEQIGVKHVVFLSVQGAERVSFIPHAKIEKLLTSSTMKYTFIRPSYFMQNLTTTLRQDIKTENRIFLPAGKAKFLWVDVGDIGAAIAAVLSNPSAHENKAYTITGAALFDFGAVCEMLSEKLNRKIDFVSPTLVRFFFAQLKKGVKVPFVFVLIMLHYLPRFQKSPEISEDFFFLTGKKPMGLKDFIAQNEKLWM